MWKGQQEDNDEAMEFAKELDYCRRSKGWKSSACVDDLKARVAAPPQPSGNPNDPSTLAIGDQRLDTMIVFCHNPVTKADHPSGGKVGLSPRQGDLRHNQVVLHRQAMRRRRGYQRRRRRPAHGREAAASINIWTHVTDLAPTGGLTDIVRYVNGELELSEITEGTYVNNWGCSEQACWRSGQMPTMTREEVVARTNSIGGAKTGVAGGKELTQEQRDKIAEGGQRSEDQDEAGHGHPCRHRRDADCACSHEPGRGTELEASS
ncbi:MAG: hypothetical protein U0165_07895 [Polyangiaceae bacterium]